MTTVLNYGGGRQTMAMLCLIAKGILPKPDRIIIADTGREKSSTWDYLFAIAEPLAQSFGMNIEIAPRSLAYVDLYGHNGDLLLPVYTATGKMTAFCSTEWKARVVRRFLTAQGVGAVINWIGFALDERKRVKGTEGRAFPLLDLGLTKRDCIQIISDAGFPLPPPSSCWMCPNMPNEEWRYIRDNYPVDFERACALDEEIREQDIFNGGGGVWLHHSRQPLRTADLDIEDRAEPQRQCGLGMCFL